MLEAAATAAAQLLNAGLSADARADGGVMLHKVSGRAAMRLGAALGPVLETCGTLPYASQVSMSTDAYAGRPE